VYVWREQLMSAGRLKRRQKRCGAYLDHAVAGRHQASKAVRTSIRMLDTKGPDELGGVVWVLAGCK